MPRWYFAWTRFSKTADHDHFFCKENPGLEAAIISLKIKICILRELSSLRRGKELLAHCLYFLTHIYSAISSGTDTESVGSTLHLFIYGYTNGVEQEFCPQECSLHYFFSEYSQNSQEESGLYSPCLNYSH